MAYWCYAWPCRFLRSVGCHVHGYPVHCTSLVAPTYLTVCLRRGCHVVLKETNRSSRRPPRVLHVGAKLSRTRKPPRNPPNSAAVRCWSHGTTAGSHLSARSRWKRTAQHHHHRNCKQHSCVCAAGSNTHGRVAAVSGSSACVNSTMHEAGLSTGRQCSP